MATQQPAQPSKQAAYKQSNNPVSHAPIEQRDASQRQYGDAVPSILRRTADSKPSNEDSIAQLKEKRQHEQQSMQAASDVDLEYGVEQQPGEGNIANAVKHKAERARAQAGAHAGPVGGANGPGYTGFGQEKSLAADMPRKREEHDRILGERIGQSPPEPDMATAQSEAVRERKLKVDENLDVKGAVQEGTGDPVVGS